MALGNRINLRFLRYSSYFQGLNVMGGAGLKGRRGAFYLFDFNDPEAGATEIKVLDGDVENPHGLGIWEDPKSGKYKLNELVCFYIK